MVKKRWADFSTGQKAALIAAATLQVGLLVAALWDLAHRSAAEIRGDRRMWAGLVFINWVGPLAYFAIGRKGFLSGALMRCCASMPCCAPGPEEADSVEADPEA